MKEVFLPKVRIPIYNDNQLDEYRLLYTGKKNIYESVYTYQGEGKEDIIGKNAIIDKIFLDFDYDINLKFFDDVKRVANYLYESNLIFYIRFSGRGFHIYIKLDDKIRLNNPQKAIRTWVKKLHNKTNTESDPAVVGDVRRVSRMMGSMNMKTHLYCIPISYTDLLNLSYMEICERAKFYTYTDASIDYIQGSELLDLSECDSEYKKTYITKKINSNNIKITNEYPPCIQQMLKNPELGYYARGQLIIYLRDDGYGLDEILLILKSILSEEKYYHCTEEEQQPYYLYNVREDIIFSSCPTLKNNGLCCSEECTGHYLYI